MNLFKSVWFFVRLLKSIGYFGTILILATFFFVLRFNSINGKFINGWWTMVDTVVDVYIFMVCWVICTNELRSTFYLCFVIYICTSTYMMMMRNILNNILKLCGWRIVCIIHSKLNCMDFMSVIILFWDAHDERKLKRGWKNFMI